MSRATQKALEKKEQAQQRREERNHERKKEQIELQQAFNANGELSRGWMEEILNTDDLEAKLQPNTVRKVQSMLNKQWIVANLTDAETHDRIYWLEVQKYKIYSEHPRDGCGVEGPVRAFLFDDEHEQLRPLSSQERNAIDQVITGLKNMVTRARGGFEREQINTNIARTESDDDGGGDDSSGWGLFG